MKVTAHILALYFLAGSLLPGSDFSQIRKAPAVWEHYRLHQELAAGSGDTDAFIDFLYDHFWNPDSHQHGDGGQSHQDLPLKTIHIFSPVLTAAAATFVLTAPPCVNRQSIPHYRLFTGCTYEGAVFRPPILS